MATKAVINLCGFSLGDTNSMASLLLPLTPPNQDVRDYDVLKDLAVENELVSSLVILYNQKTPTAEAVFRFARILEFNTPTITEADEYIAGWSQLKWYNAVALWLRRIMDKAQEMLEEFDSDVYDWNSAVSELKNRTVNGGLYIFGFALKFYQKEKEHLKDVVDGIERTEESINSVISQVQAVYDYWDYGDNGTIEGFPSHQTLKKSFRKTERDCPEFCHILRYLREPTEAEKKYLIHAFEVLRCIANGKLLKQYVADSKQYPYFLDLEFDNGEEYDDETDEYGRSMHSLKRQLNLDDEWVESQRKGDKLRIRDMYRVDKLNKVSAYETRAFNPSRIGVELDRDLETRDVISRLVQDDRKCDNVAGIAQTSYGAYVLTEAGKADGISVKGVTFPARGFSITDTFKSFAAPTRKSENYLVGKLLNTSENLMRRFTEPSEAASASDTFNDWYDKYANKAMVKVSAVQGTESVLRIVGKNSYEWYPCDNGIRYIDGLYEEEQYENAGLDDTSYDIEKSGLHVKAGFADNNYRANVVRKLSIDIPAGTKVQYSYLDLSVKLNIDDWYFKREDGWKVLLEFSVDDEKSVKFFLYGKEKEDRVEDLTETNSLYTSLKGFLTGERTVPDANNEMHFRFIIENDVISNKTKKFHIGVSANLTPLSDLVISDEVQKSYDATYVEISSPEISYANTPNELTYGNYHEHSTDCNKDDFWNLSAAMFFTPHQYVMESPRTVSLIRGSSIGNNYTTATIYSDVFTAKNHMDSEYRMQVSGEGTELVLDKFRHYTGIDTCSDSISLYYDTDHFVKTVLDKDNADEMLGQEYVSVEENVLDKTDTNTVKDGDDIDSLLRFKRIEVVKAINRLQHDTRHKSNLFSVSVNNSTIPQTLSSSEAELAHDEELLKDSDLSPEKRQELEADVTRLKKIIADANSVKTLITNSIQNICKQYAPAHNQLFKVYFT